MISCHVKFVGGTRLPKVFQAVVRCQSSSSSLLVLRVCHITVFVDCGNVINLWPLCEQDFCYYANAIFVVMLLYFPNNDKLFLICFSFAEVSELCATCNLSVVP